MNYDKAILIENFDYVSSIHVCVILICDVLFLLIIIYHTYDVFSQSTIYINDIKAGERIVIVDDVISTGGTLEPLIQQLEDMGVILQDIVIAIEKGEGRERLNREKPHWPIRSLARIDIIDGSY